ncbi:MAG: radical SAM protein [Patescibacteria group bacterium]
MIILEGTVALAPFSHPDITAKGELRAKVALEALQTLWFNTGTLCNIECCNCYILSSPKNDALVYLTVEDVQLYLDEIRDQGLATQEIGFTGGEPFMNPSMCAMAEFALSRGFRVLVLTNAMQPMMRPKVRQELTRLIKQYGERLTFRVSLDHYSAEVHDHERGSGAFDMSLAGMRWLHEQHALLAVAGRQVMAENEAEARSGFATLFAEEGFTIDADKPDELVLFPEMDEQVEVPEITTACWRILDKRSTDVMCASSRMVVKRKGAKQPVVLACTLLAYHQAFELGHTLAEADRPVALNHPHCAKFCVLGGASCSG